MSQQGDRHRRVPRRPAEVRAAISARELYLERYYRRVTA